MWQTFAVMAASGAVLLVGSLVMSTKISSDESTFSFVINGINNLIGFSAAAAARGGGGGGGEDALEGEAAAAAGLRALGGGRVDGGGARRFGVPLRAHGDGAAVARRRYERAAGDPGATGAGHRVPTGAATTAAPER